MRSSNPKLDALRSLDLFDGVRTRDLRDLALRVDEADLAPGEVLIEQGHLHRHAYVVVSGRLEVVVDGDVVATVGTGSIVGERAALNHDVANARVRCAEAASVLIIDHRSLLGISGLAPEVEARLRALVDRRDAQLTAA